MIDKYKKKLKISNIQLTKQKNKLKMYLKRQKKET